MFDLRLITVVYCTSLIHALLICTTSAWRSLSLNTYYECIYVIDHVFLIAFIDLNMSDDSQNSIH